MTRVAAAVLIVCACHHPDAERGAEVSVAPAEAAASASPLAPSVSVSVSASAAAEPEPSASATASTTATIVDGNQQGSGEPIFGGAHRTLQPHVRIAGVEVVGRLPKEVVQRIVRREMGRFQACYKTGLAKNPTLEGKVATKFVVAPAGQVTELVKAPATTMTDGAVVACVLGVLRSIHFPSPEQGSAAVSYDLAFAPPDD